MEQIMRRPEVCVIPATVRSVENGGQIKKQKELRVAAYCRVSTGDESQQTSYTTQKRFYTQMILRKPGWTLVGIYADEAISGTSRARRKQFNEMINDALEGKIDYIITKSISRFARNTIDTLECVRQLRELNPPVGIFFEKENIDTLDATGELILTILSALAQDESRSISDNIRWSIQRKFQNGEAMVDLNRLTGYDKGPHGEWIINPEQAETVRYIFDQYVNGTSANAIAKQLNSMGKRTVKGCIWRSDSVLNILRNEKYVGDCESQKYITKNFLTHKCMINNGEAVKYYVKNHHEAIIDRITWGKVQAILMKHGIQSSKRKVEPKKRRGPKGSVFFNLTCGELHDGKPCGEKLSRMGYNNLVLNYTDSRSVAAEGLDPSEYEEKYYYYYPVWKCSRNKHGRKNAGAGCTSIPTYECALEQSFMEMLYRHKRDIEANGENSWLMQQFRSVYEQLELMNDKNSFSMQRLEIINMQIQELEENLNKTIEKQLEALQYAAMDNHVSISSLSERRSLEDTFVNTSDSDANIYEQLADDIRSRIKELKEEMYTIEVEQESAAEVRKNFDYFIQCLKELPEINYAGMPMNINGIDVNGSLFRDINGKAIGAKRSRFRRGYMHIDEQMIAETPDYLNFEKGIYMSFIKSGQVRGDVVEYQTNFGLKLITTGNRRTLSSFLGFRRANPDKTLTLLDEHWKISGREVCYTRKKK